MSIVFFFKQKTAYEMRIGDWSSDVCSSDLDTVTIVANYIPLEEPAGGPNFSNFSENVLYEIKVDNTGDAKSDVTYQFRFDTSIADSDQTGRASCRERVCQ